MRAPTNCGPLYYVKRTAEESPGSFGSLISTHFQADVPRGPEDVKTPPIFRKRFQLFMINIGIFITRRGQFTVSMANPEDEFSALENAFGKRRATD